MRRLPFALALLLIGTTSVLLLLSGCGGNASPTASSAPPATPAPSTPTPPSSGGSGGSGSPGPTTPTFTPPPNTQLQQSIIVNGAAGHGSVYVSTGGDVTIQLTGAQASASYGWQFCGLGTANPPCFDLAHTLMTDATGSGQLTFHFPRPGKWAGFFLGSSGGATASTQSATLGTMSANFLSEQQLNGTPPCGTCRYETLQSGTVSVANGVAHIVLVNADPGNPNQVQEVDLLGATTTNLGTVTMDANDNLTADVPLQGASGAAITLWDRSNAAIISGFQVP